MQPITEPLTLLLNERANVTETSKQGSQISLQIMELMKNEASVYTSAPALTPDQVALRRLHFETLAEEFDLGLLQAGLFKAHGLYDFRPTPSQVRKQVLAVKEERALRRDEANERSKQKFKQLLGCSNNCGNGPGGGGLYLQADVDGVTTTEVCDCLRRHWEAGGKHLFYCKS